MEAFRDFSFPEELLAGTGLAQIDRAAKQKILFDNYQTMTGLDLAARLPATADDAFARRRASGPAAPFSTLREAQHA